MPAEVEEAVRPLTEEDFIHVEAPPLEILLSDVYKKSMFRVALTLDERSRRFYQQFQGPWPRDIAQEAINKMTFQRKQYATVGKFIEKYQELLSKDLKYPSIDMDLRSEFVPLVGETLWELAVTGAMIEIAANPTWVGGVHAECGFRGADAPPYTAAEKEAMRKRFDHSCRVGEHDILAAYAFGMDYFPVQGREPLLLNETSFGWDLKKVPELFRQEAARRMIFSKWESNPQWCRTEEFSPVIPEKYVALLLKEKPE